MNRNVESSELVFAVGAPMRIAVAGRATDDVFRAIVRPGMTSASLGFRWTRVNR